MSELEEVPVLRSDLQGMLDLLNALYSQHFAQDLVEQYRKLDNRNRRSPLTLAIDTQRQKVESYITHPITEEEPDDIPA